MKAVQERAVRERSPAPGMRHRRDKSEGRFPVVAASPTANASAGAARNVSGNMPAAGGVRNSLEVPGSQDGSPSHTTANGALHEKVEPAPVVQHVPGAFTGGGPGPHIPPPPEEGEESGLGRSTFGSGGRKMGAGYVRTGAAAGIMARGREAAGREEQGQGSGGVTLSDRPMDD